MDAVLTDPDVKANMNLDEIIHLTNRDLRLRLGNRNARQFKKKRRNKKAARMAGRDHSIPLLSSSRGVGIYVSEGSPLLNVENKRRIAQSISNLTLNYELIDKSKKMIPAEYKLMKTTQQVERVLVPSTTYMLQQRRNLFLPRKLNKETLLSGEQSEDIPPPLIAAPIYKELEKSRDSLEMEVDSSDDDIILDASRCWEQQRKEIDVKSNIPENLLVTKKLFMQKMMEAPKVRQKTLNDHFTMVTGSL